MKRLEQVAAGVLIAAIAAAPAAADEISDFYKGKSVNIVVGHEPATGFDIYARVLHVISGGTFPATPTSWCRTWWARAGSPPPTGSTMSRPRTAR